MTESEEEMLKNATMFVEEVKFLFRERHFLLDENSRLRLEIYKLKQKLNLGGFND